MNKTPAPFSGIIVLDKAAVAIYGAGGGNAVEADQNALSFGILGEGEVLSVPSVIIPEIPVGIVLGGIVILVDDVVVG